MRGSIFEFVGNLDTLIAVVIGAILATGGALFAELIQDRLNRRRRERESARFFGEVLSSIDRILDFAFHSQTIGEPFGSVTRRLFRTALREAGVYERNRERLFDIRSMSLRTRIHSHFLVETFPIEAIIEYCEELDALEELLRVDGQPSAQTEELNKRADDLRERLSQATESLRKEHAKTCDICDELEKLAGVKFEHYSTQPGQITTPPITTPAENSAS